MRKPVYISFVFLFSFFGKLAAQNICTNGGFETYTAVPTTYAQICFATGWSSPSGICALVAGTGSPDYYNTLGSGGARPPATWWATVSPHSGNGIVGFVTVYPGSSPNYREYVARQLSAPLVIGQKYNITMWVTNGVSTLHQLGANNLGVAFSSAPLVQTLGTPIAYVPQCEMAAVLYSTTWVQVTFSYTATAAYQYITIGNFRNDAATTMQSFGGTYGCYYYIDDVDVRIASVLPVTFTYFNSEPSGEENLLRWGTASEMNSSYFAVEKSSDGENFSEIGRVSAAGNSTMNNDYSFTDLYFSQASYYRLKEVDYDGSLLYSEIIYSQRDVFANGEASIYINSNNELVCDLLSAVENKFEIKMYSPLGVLVASYSGNADKNAHSVILKLPALAGGIYFVSGMISSKPFCKKIISR